jgi:hypothetical protein
VALSLKLAVNARPHLQVGGLPRDGGNPRPNALLCPRRPHRSTLRPSQPRIKMTFASRNLTLDAQSQYVSYVKCTNLCIAPNAKPLKSFTRQSQPKMFSDTPDGAGSTVSARSRGGCDPLGSTVPSQDPPRSACNGAPAHAVPWVDRTAQRFGSRSIAVGASLILS